MFILQLKFNLIFNNVKFYINFNYLNLIQTFNNKLKSKCKLNYNKTFYGLRKIKFFI